MEARFLGLAVADAPDKDPATFGVAHLKLASFVGDRSRLGDIPLEVDYSVF